MQIFLKTFFHIHIFPYLCNAFTGCSAVGSALRSGRRGRAFESPHPDQSTNSNTRLSNKAEPYDSALFAFCGT